MLNEAVLTIGDCYALNYLIHTVLSKDFAVTSVRSCAEAIGHLQTDLNKKVIILDISDSNCSNFELLEHLNTSAILKNIKVIVISNSDDESLKIKTRELGALYFLSKPFDPIYLSNLVKNLINFGSYDGFIKRKTVVKGIPFPARILR